jgi:hypothetical protein
MAYTINLTNGNILATIADGTINSTTTSLTLIGKNYAGYGTFLNDNLVHILENASNSTAPTTPLTGQLWWDTAGNLKVYTGSAFKNLGSITAANAKPSSAVTGNSWWDTVNQQFYVYDPNYSSNAGWALIGPAATASQGTSGAIVGSISDNAGNLATHVAVNVYVSSTLVGIFSKDSYTPSATISGFTTIYPGLNLSSTLANTKVWGTAYTADQLGGVVAASYARTDTNTTFTAPVTISSASGLTVGPSSTFNLNLNGNVVQLNNTVNNSNIAIRANTAGSYVNSILIDGSTSNVTMAANLLVSSNVNATNGVFTNAVATGNVTAANVTVSANVNASQGVFSSNVKAANVVVTANVNAVAGIYSGNVTAANYITSGNINASYLIGTAIQSFYADLAERFEADADYSPGTVLAIGGSAEVTIENQELSENVFGVISTNAGFLLNGSAGSNSTHPQVAVNGRVPVRVIGKIKKGDRLVSAGSGLARAGSKSEITAFNVLGRSLEDKLTIGEGVVTAIVKLNS